MTALRPAPIALDVTTYNEVHSPRFRAAALGLAASSLRVPFSPTGFIEVALEAARSAAILNSTSTEIARGGARDGGIGGIALCRPGG